MFRCAVNFAYAYTDESGPGIAPGTTNGFAPGSDAASPMDSRPAGGSAGNTRPAGSGIANTADPPIRAKYRSFPSGDQLTAEGSELELRYAHCLQIGMGIPPSTE